MKELIILRHAKSNRTYSVDDINRPLSPEGIERIKKVSHQKEDFFTKADIIISSPAIRALHTAMITIHELNLPLEQLKIDKQLYTFSGFSVIDYIYTLDDRWNKVILAGHNPAFTQVINHFSDAGINHLRTAGCVQITFDGDQWSNLYKGEVLLGQKNNNV
jgi:phosphohistidine phosphatase